MPTEFSVNKRDVQFVLYEQLEVDDLCKLPAYSECNRELFEMVIDEAIKMATDVMAPLNAVGDREGLKLEDGKVITPDEFKPAWRKYAEGGWVGMIHDPELGGQGMPQVLKFTAEEIFSGANVAFFLNSILTEGAAHLIDKFGTPQQRKMYCEKMYTGQWAGDMCLTEPSAGSDVGNLKTTAKKNGDHYLISGSKIFITCGDHDLTENIIHPVLARIEGAPAGTKGISLFVVPKYVVNPDGSLGEQNDVTCSGIEHKMGIKASPTCTLNFGDEGKCKGWLLGEENTGMRLMFQMMNEARLGVGVQGLGLAAVGYLSALGYSQERTQGPPWNGAKDADRALIVTHPDVRRMLMRMKAFVEGMRSLMYSVARYIDLAAHAADDKEKERYSHYVELLTPICKAYGSDMGFRINEIAIQVYGGYGYCQEYPVEQYCRDQKISSIYEGTNGIQALDLLGRKVGGKGGLYFKEYMDLLDGFIKEHKSHKDLGELVAKLDAAKGELIKVTLKFGELMKADPLQPLLGATPYLEAFGHIVVSYYLLDAAVKAAAKLEAICQEKGAADDKARAKLLSNNSEAAFYHGRVASARYFVHNVLPEVYALSAGMLSGDKSAMEVVYPT